MIDNLKVGIIQSDILWEDIDGNLLQFEQKISQIGEVDLIVLPEMFTTGFSMKSAELAETMDGKTMKWLRKISAIKNCDIVCSIIIKEEDKNYNRLVWMKPDGNYETYDKRHLFRMSDEHEHFSQGNKRIVVEIKGWKVCPLICYDLRFPVWSRNTENFDALIFVANWPESRREPWRILLKARAIENQTYVIAANRLGSDAHGTTFAGDSVVLNPKGIKISKTEPFHESVEEITLSRKELDDFRQKFPVSLDADEFMIK